MLLILHVVRVLLVQLVEELAERPVLGGLKDALNEVAVRLKHREAQVAQNDRIVRIDLRVVPQLRHDVAPIEDVCLFDQASVAFHDLLVAEGDGCRVRVLEDLLDLHVGGLEQVQVVAEDGEGQRVVASQAQEPHEEAHSRVAVRMRLYRNKPLLGVLLSQVVNAILLIHELRVEMLKVEQVYFEVVGRRIDQVESLLDNLRHYFKRFLQSLRGELGLIIADSPHDMYNWLRQVLVLWRLLESLHDSQLLHLHASQFP